MTLAARQFPTGAGVLRIDRVVGIGGFAALVTQVALGHGMTLLQR